MAGGIRGRLNKNGASWIGGDGDDKEEEPIRYCPHCLLFGFKVALGPKIILKGESKPPDWDQWLTCPECGNTYPKYEVKTESRLTDVVEITDDPFDMGHNIIGIQNKVKENPRQEELRKIRENIEKEKDPDIRAALKRGATVNILSDDDYRYDAYLS